MLDRDSREAVDCMFCDLTDVELYSRAKSCYDERWFDVVRCNRCGLVYVSPRIANKPTEIEYRATDKRQFANPAQLRAKHSDADLQLRRLERHCPPGRLLDFGAGQGVLVHQAIRRGWDAYGMELDKNLVAGANEYWGDERLWSEPLEIILERHRGQFDAVISTSVFEHLSYPLEMLKSLRLLLRPGGTLLIAVPNLDCYKERQQRGVTLDPTAHLYYFTGATLTRMIQDAGFVVVACCAKPNNISTYRRIFDPLRLGLLSEALAQFTEALPLPDIGNGVYALAHLPPTPLH